MTFFEAKNCILFHMEIISETRNLKVDYINNHKYAEIYRPCAACNDDGSRKTTHKEKIEQCILIALIYSQVRLTCHSDVRTLCYEV